MGNPENVAPFQFKPGNTFGKGRTKGSKNVATMVRQILEAELTFKDKDTGNTETKKTREWMDHSLVRQVIHNGSVNAYNSLYDRAYGKVPQKSEITGEDGEPININNMNLTKEQIDALVRIKNGE